MSYIIEQVKVDDKKEIGVRNILLIVLMFHNLLFIRQLYTYLH